MCVCMFFVFIFFPSRISCVNFDKPKISAKSFGAQSVFVFSVQLPFNTFRRFTTFFCGLFGCFEPLVNVWVVAFTCSSTV